MTNNYLNQSIPDRIPPQATDIEAAVLGALMMEPGQLEEVSYILSQEVFYKLEHQKIFKVISEMRRSGKAIDLLTVTQELKNRSELEDIGGHLYITELVSRAPSAAHMSHYARIIAQKYIQREIIRKSREIESLAYDDTNLDNINEIWAQFDDRVNGIFYGSDTGKHQSDVIKEAIEEIEADIIQARQGKAPGISTGFPSLDDILGGWRKTNLIYLASRPGMGKTSFALKFAIEAASAGYWVNFFAFEMKRADLMRILFSAYSGVNRSAIRDGKVPDSDWERINPAISFLKKLPIKWIDNAGINANQIRSIIRRNRKAGKCNIAIIDYLQLIVPSISAKLREQEVSQISRTLKTTALGEDIPILCLAQLNREADREEPRLSHLRESGSLEQDADVVLFPWRPGMNGGKGDNGQPIPDDEIKMIVAKNRRGRLGSFKIRANSEMTQFVEMDRYGQPLRAKRNDMNLNPDEFIEPGQDEGDMPF